MSEVLSRQRRKRRDARCHLLVQGARSSRQRTARPRKMGSFRDRIQRPDPSSVSSSNGRRLWLARLRDERRSDDSMSETKPCDCPPTWDANQTVRGHWRGCSAVYEDVVEFMYDGKEVLGHVEDLRRVFGERAKKPISPCSKCGALAVKNGRCIGCGEPRDN